MKNLAVLLVSLAFAADALAQTPAPDTAQGPVQVAQAGGAAQGAAVPAASTGAGGTATAVAIVAAGVAAIASVTAYNTTSSNH